MRKVFIQCECGQRMQVARAAIGKIGMCPTCGRKMRISEGTTQPLANGRNTMGSGRRPSWRNVRWGRQDAAAREDAKRMFGRAADLFCNGQYGEALALFDELVERFPGNPDIENAREQCVLARSRKPLGLPHHGPKSASQFPSDREGMRRAIMDKLVDKLQHGSTDMVQLQAAELIARMEGLLDNHQSARSEASESDAVADREDDDSERPEEEDVSPSGAAPDEKPARPTPPPFDPADFEEELRSESTL